MVAAIRGILAALHTPNVVRSTRSLTRSDSPHLPLRVSSAPARTRAPFTTMFKKAVDSHDASQPKSKSKSLAQQLFPSSSPTDTSQPSKHVPRSGAQPLSTGTGNILKQKSSGGQSGPSAPFRKPSFVGGIKRTSSGLEKALSVQDDDFAYPTLPKDTQQPSISHGATVPTSTETYFDENDFDSDIDLDVEDPSTMSTVEYPKIIQPPPSRPPTIFKPTNVLNAAQSRASVDSGYGGSPQVFNWEPKRASSKPVKQEPPSSSNNEIPWSSSPADHFRTPPQTLKVEQFEYKNVPMKTEDAEPTPRPAKRRGLPWMQQQEEEHSAQEYEEHDTHQSRYRRQTSPAKLTNDFTPLPKNSAKEQYPWNTTASAVKQQQKNLRQATKQANKKLVKSNEATDEGLKEAVENHKKKNISKVFLSEEQQHVLRLVTEQKKSVFFTGSAGTGKSVLLREIITSLRRKYAKEPDRVAVTASTGLAACNVGGVTLHSFSGIGLGKESAEELVKKIRRNQKARHRWMRARVLIVDEVSMVDGEMFDKLETIARTIRNNGRPFGGIQIVITGDFFQLPPVPDNNKPTKFAFEAGTWNTCIEYTIALHHVFRQKDPVFANMLNEMREGRLTPASISSFRSLDRPLPPIGGKEEIQATELFPTRNEVDRANYVRMHALPGEARVFEAKDGGSITDKAMRDKLLQNCMAPEAVTLKKGAQVMLIKNVDDSLVNGSLGKVVGFMSEAAFDKYNNDEKEYNQQLQDTDDFDLNLAQPRMKKKLDLAASTVQQYPMVRFAIADGTTRDLLCQRESWKIELPNGEVQASRSQIPLILAWALSIHKAQGQTLERVKVDLGKVFEKGQAYVALSRATNMAGLQVLRFDAKKVVAHDRVRHFYKSLSRAGENTDNDDQPKSNTMGSMLKKGSTTAKFEKEFVEEDLDEFF